MVKNVFLINFDNVKTDEEFDQVKSFFEIFETYLGALIFNKFMDPDASSDYGINRLEFFNYEDSDPSSPVYKGPCTNAYITNYDNIADLSNIILNYLNTSQFKSKYVFVVIGDIDKILIENTISDAVEAVTTEHKYGSIAYSGADVSYDTVTKMKVLQMIRTLDKYRNVIKRNNDFTNSINAQTLAEKCQSDKPAIVKDETTVKPMPVISHMYITFMHNKAIFGENERFEEARKIAYIFNSIREFVNALSNDTYEFEPLCPYLNEENMKSWNHRLTMLIISRSNDKDINNIAAAEKRIKKFIFNILKLTSLEKECSVTEIIHPYDEENKHMCMTGFSAGDCYNDYLGGRDDEYDDNAYTTTYLPETDFLDQEPHFGDWIGELESDAYAICHNAQELKRIYVLSNNNNIANELLKRIQ